LHKIKGKMYNDTLYVYKQNSIACTSFFFIRKPKNSQNILQKGSADSHWPIFGMTDHKDPRERKIMIMKL